MTAKRLTIHVTDAPTFSKRDKKTGKMKTCIMNTFTRIIKNESEIEEEVKYLEREGMRVTKKYLSNI